jgi:dTDP-4-amino-4,6-dideoxygalactose transaminase
MVYYPVPLHLQALYQNSGYQAGQFPVAEQLSQEVLSLPMFPELTTVQQDAVIYAIKDCLSQ